MTLPKMNGYVKIFKDKGGYENNNNELMFLQIYVNKLQKKSEPLG